MKVFIGDILSLSAAIFAGLYLITSGMKHMWTSFKELVADDNPYETEHDFPMDNHPEITELTAENNARQERTFARLRDMKID